MWKKEVVKSYVNDSKEELFSLLKDLCHIPAPSHMEEKRAAFCKEWLEQAGAEGVYIDEALNVVFPLNCEGSNEITVYVAHTDTVFPDTEPYPYSDDGEIIRCPGVGDDTASLAVMLMTAKFLIKNDIRPVKGALFVCNSCEEGLGNLKGTRQIFKDYEGRIGQFISLDSGLNVLHDACVGSHRYEVEVLTEGGHSFQGFGKANAIAKLSEIITEIYQIRVPEREGIRTTYNVGIVSGGTSVNTIAQSAKMLCEYRSDSAECLAIMKEKFAEIFHNAETGEVKVRVEMIGERPCGKGVDEKKTAELRDVCGRILEEVTGKPVICKSASTDCNIPLSLGVPAMCFGVYRGGGAHTREEWLEKASLIPGLEASVQITLALSGEVE